MLFFLDRGYRVIAHDRRGHGRSTQTGSYAKKFSGKYAHRTITNGVGHNLPQEAPQAFAQAIRDVNRL